jgi:diguanylate cyclase (GGDEF)-like protein
MSGSPSRSGKENAAVTSTFPRDVSIRTKLTAALGLALVFVIAVGLFGLLQLQAVNEVTREIREVRLPQIQTLALIKRLASEHKLLATRRTQTTNFHQLAAISSGMDETQKGLAAAADSYASSTDDPDERDLFDQFRALWSDYHAALKAVLQQLEVGQLSRADHAFRTAALTNAEGAVEKLDRLVALSKQKSQNAAARADRVYGVALLWTAVAIILAALCAFATALWVSRHVASPILRVSEAMRRLSSGDDTVVIADDRARHDEIGVLVGAVTGYRDALVSSRRFAAAADLERERLQAAITNMPIGLCMFDAAERLIVCNDVYADMYRLPPALTRPGTSLDDIYRMRLEMGVFPRLDPAAYKAEVISGARGTERVLKIVELQDGRIVSTFLQPMAAGGWVAVHEDITERRRAEERINHMARHDALTGLPNRVHFKEKISDALKRVPRGEAVAVLCLDLDRFKAVNDTLGHPVGDALLKQVAERLSRCVRDIDMVARFGGDEFAIVQVAAGQPRGATTLARRIIKAVNAPYDIDGHEIVVGISVGIALAPSDGAEPDVLLKNGDMALYRAKSDGRGTFRFFEREMDEHVQARRALELDLRNALANSEFELFYQPVVNIARNEVTSFEALLRWRNPKRGMVPPAEFIPLAEEIGLVAAIGEWVLQQACRDAANWPEHIKVAVNLSPVQFRIARLYETVAAALARAKLPPGRLELEITEGVLLAETEATLTMLHKLRALGVGIALDDFGTGYSSLSYLRSFPFDRIKIDRSFVQNVSDGESSLAIIRAVASLSASLGMAITAEGVETAEQLQRIYAAGCSEVQGFLFSPPRPASEIELLLSAIREQVGVAA